MVDGSHYVLVRPSWEPGSSSSSSHYPVRHVVGNTRCLMVRARAGLTVVFLSSSSRRPPRPGRRSVSEQWQVYLVFMVGLSAANKASRNITGPGAVLDVLLLRRQDGGCSAGIQEVFGPPAKRIKFFDGTWCAGIRGVGVQLAKV